MHRRTMLVINENEVGKGPKPDPRLFQYFIISQDAASM